MRLGTPFQHLRDERRGKGEGERWRGRRWRGIREEREGKEVDAVEGRDGGESDEGGEGLGREERWM